jgi:hypothetical protein
MGQTYSKHEIRNASKVLVETPTQWGHLADPVLHRRRMKMNPLET